MILRRLERMPIYSYRCGKCGRIFDRVEKFGNNGKRYCDYCNAEAFRVFSPVGIIFKGSGFYSTDYKSSSNKSISNNIGKKDKEKSKKEDIKDSKKSKSETQDAGQKSTSPVKK
ncbi:MAG: hypothetical protein ISS13_00990 [Actinobacteria bacterium]|nr:hypothetical protein [Actinomycetota bacterium]